MEKKLFEYQEEDTNDEEHEWPETMMMLSITVIEWISADEKRQHDHPYFKGKIVNDINAEEWNAGKE